VGKIHRKEGKKKGKIICIERPDKTVSRTQRRQEIKQKIKIVGLWNINKTELSKYYKTSRDAIYRDIKAIIASAPNNELEVIKFVGDAGLKKIVSESWKIMIDPRAKHSDRINAGNLMRNTIKDIFTLAGLRTDISFIQNNLQVNDNRQTLNVADLDAVLEDVRNAINITSEKIEPDNK